MDQFLAVSVPETIGPEMCNILYQTLLEPNLDQFFTVSVPEIIGPEMCNILYQIELV